jgi:hypothetical protein
VLHVAQDTFFVGNMDYSLVEILDEVMLLEVDLAFIHEWVPCRSSGDWSFRLNGRSFDRLGSLRQHLSFGVSY